MEVIAESNIHWARPESATGTGALIVAGSSGRVDVDRAEMLASRAETANAQST